MANRCPRALSRWYKLLRPDPAQPLSWLYSKTKSSYVLEQLRLELVFVLGDTQQLRNCCNHPMTWILCSVVLKRIFVNANHELDRQAQHALSLPASNDSDAVGSACDSACPTTRQLP